MLQMLVEADMPGDHDFGYGLADSATTMRLSKIRLAAGTFLKSVATFLKFEIPTNERELVRFSKKPTHNTYVYIVGCSHPKDNCP